MNIVTLGAGCHRLLSEVWFVAFGTGRDVAVATVVAAVTSLFCVLAWLCLQLTRLVAVAVGADTRQHVGHRHPTRSVWVFVTI